MNKNNYKKNNKNTQHKNDKQSLYTHKTEQRYLNEIKLLHAENDKLCRKIAQLVEENVALHKQLEKVK